MAASFGSKGLFLSTEKTVTAAGTAEALLAFGDIRDRWRAVTLIMKAGNTGKVYIGGPDVDSNTNDGLSAGDVLDLGKDYQSSHIFDLADIFIDVDTSGEGVDIYCTL